MSPTELIKVVSGMLGVSYSINDGPGNIFFERPGTDLRLSETRTRVDTNLSFCVFQTRSDTLLIRTLVQSEKMDGCS